MPDSENEVAQALEPDSGSDSEDVPTPDSTSIVRRNNNNNWRGRNQHKDCPDKDDERVRVALLEYHRRNITDKHLISNLLMSDHGIKLSALSVTKRKQYFGICGSAVTTATMAEVDKRQAVLDQMAKDPSSRKGVRTTKEAIVFDQGIHLTRDYITTTMRAQDPDGFKKREPTAKKVKRSPLVSLGPHHEWSGDGHEKLAAIGFPLWGVRDVWAGKWLGLWVVPNNRLKLAVGYLFLRLVRRYGGIPIQMTTDCGSETSTVFGLANALREIFASHLSTSELPAHRFLKSVHNITIERGWLQVRLQWGENVKLFWEAGHGLYNPADRAEYTLVQWLWSTLIQAECDRLCDHFNNHRVRKDRQKKLPSGTSPNVAFSLPTAYGGQEGLLIPVDMAMVEQLMEEIGGEKLIQFVSPEYAKRAQEVFAHLRMPKLEFDNVWLVFQEMLPHM